jgi:hypothetical protein
VQLGTVVAVLMIGLVVGLTFGGGDTFFAVRGSQ